MVWKGDPLRSLNDYDLEGGLALSPMRLIDEVGKTLHSIEQQLYHKSRQIWEIFKMFKIKGL